MKREKVALKTLFQMESANNPLVDAIAGALIQSKLEILTKKEILYKKAKYKNIYLRTKRYYTYLF